MSTSIFYFTGTGNSLWAARTLAEGLGDCELVPIARALAAGDIRPAADRVIIVAPVYMYRLPHIVVRFARALETRAPITLLATCGGDPGDCLRHAKRLFARRGLELVQGHVLVVQTNYLPFGSAPEAEVVEERLADASRRLHQLLPVIAGGGPALDTRCDRRRAWVHPGLLYKLGYAFIAKTDGSYVVEDSCNGCGLCAQLCPVDNLALVDGRPVWNNRCEQCMACLQWCPKEAVQVKDKTQGWRRYHHPEVKARDVIAQKG